MSVAIRRRVSRAVGALNARHRPCMSGTPVGNNLSGIWSQLGFLMPALLDGRCAFSQGAARYGDLTLAWRVPEAVKVQ